MVFIRQIISSIEYIHSKNIFHRDLSLKNIMVKKYETKSVIKLIDFGLIKNKNENQGLTKSITFVKGSYNDHATLKEKGYKNYDIKDELFVLTKVIYFILAGKESQNEVSEVLINFLNKGIGVEKTRFKTLNELKDWISEINSTMKK